MCIRDSYTSNVYVTDLVQALVNLVKKGVLGEIYNIKMCIRDRNYTNMVKKVKEENPNATVIVVLPSNLSLDNKYRLKIMEVCNENGLAYADMKTSFQQSGYAESKLTKNSLPTDMGYQIYSQTINNIIKSLIV